MVTEEELDFPERAGSNLAKPQCFHDTVYWAPCAVDFSCKVLQEAKATMILSEKILLCILWTICCMKCCLLYCILLPAYRVHITDYVTCLLYCMFYIDYITNGILHITSSLSHIAFGYSRLQVMCGVVCCGALVLRYIPRNICCIVLMLYVLCNISFKY